jgi:rhamnose utilization protein RhaD (predicted bifunctional aldolase and dehydrogenase)
VAASRLLGGDPYLVLHGGGNSSVKDGGTIHVKASGHDMATIGPDGFAPLDRAALDALVVRDGLSDTEMVAGLRAALLDPASATPSIETLLHHLLPAAAVLHTHADAVVTLTNSRDGAALLADALGPDVPVLPYCKPGFDLAHLVRREWPGIAAGEVPAFVLAHHGLFTVADRATEAASRHRALVDAAADAVREATGVVLADEPGEVRVGEDDDPALRAFGEHVRAVTGSPVSLHALRSPGVAAFLARDDLAEVTQRGPSTLEHVIRTHRTPLVGRDVEGYVAAYTAYVDRNRHRAGGPVTLLDPTPRVVLDPELGLVTVARTPAQARVAEDIYRHTMRIITAAEALGGYRTITEGQAFDIEYWELEQAKLR